ncbi:magnesium chelatase [Salipaludibacillus keqinensis]|uniref:Magnesium chelatase n=1 Tax=Salipaludibacillus keqinensis TaxID=2045207 RepID=A0A323TMK8_9BACI|nr:MoxR family ATPase [Salipaludibacillus keqinensis]PYZ94887.1 magnesium chelatase [Salipaludibacillus keqinensis]
MTAKEFMDACKGEISKNLIGKDTAIEWMCIALLAKGHVLIDDIPGTGKSELAKSFAKTISGSLGRIQGTPDVMPSDVTGFHYFDQTKQTFIFREGPVFHSLVLMDEINRATPKTQASLFEAMQERQVTVDGERFALPTPFMVMATQNPTDLQQGTYILPHAQLDRFSIKMPMERLSYEEELQLIRRFQGEDYKEINAVIDLERIRQLQTNVSTVTLSEDVEKYLLEISQETRKHESIEVGVSPRATLNLMKIAQARALVHERLFVTPDDIYQMAPLVYTHRLILKIDVHMRQSPEEVMNDVLSRVKVPVENHG